MAPLTRSRAQQPGDLPGDLIREYYSQRASEGGFIVSEGTSISATARGWFGAPGLYSDQQVKGGGKSPQLSAAKALTFSLSCGIPADRRITK
jgi:N-ethylmaleimide reductase